MINDTIKLMTDINKQIGYDLNEQDIDTVLHYMQLNDHRTCYVRTSSALFSHSGKNLYANVISTVYIEADLDEFYKQFIKSGSIKS